MPTARCLVVLLGLATQTGQPKWTGHSSEYTIVWTAKNLSAFETISKVTILNLKSHLHAEFVRLSARPHDSYLRWESDVALESVVGPYLSVSNVRNLDFHGPHADVVATLQTFDLKRSRPGKPVVAKLKDLFPEQAIYESLLAERRLGSAFSSGTKPRDLASLMKELEGQVVTADGKLLSILDQANLMGRSGGPCWYSLSSGFADRFAIYDYAGGTATVQMGLSSHGGCVGEMLRIEIRLGVPQDLRPAFDFARLRKSGFLGKDREQIAPKDAATVIEFLEKSNSK